jgi:peptidoglycan/xylan/chitin deacetylase (PgdA/CDA1 family)
MRYKLNKLIKSAIPKAFLSNKKKLVVLAYHRIDNVKTDPWQINVEPDKFEDQVKMLTSKYNVIGLDALKKQISTGIIEDNQVLITFDDAYLDNYKNAKPILEKYNCPALFFVPSFYLGQKKMFWSDELGEIFLNAKVLPKNLSITVKGKKVDFIIEKEVLSDEELIEHKKWSVHQPAISDRCKTFFNIWKLLQPLPQNSIIEVIDEIRIWANFDANNESNYPMSAQQLIELSDNKLFSIGLHTYSHPALASHPYNIQYDEISNCKIELEKLLGKEVDTIAYPYGSYNKDTLTILKKLQVSLGFSTKGKTFNAKSKLGEIGRFQPFNWFGSELEKHMENWYYFSLLLFI